MDVDELITSTLGGSKITDLKTKDDYTKSAKKALAIIAINPEDIHPYGSASYKAQPYPGDLDASEIIGVCCSKEKAINELEKGLIDVVENIEDTPGYYLGDIKLGLDLIFNINIGQFVDGILYDYDSIEIRRHINDLFINGYLTEKEAEDLLFFVKNNITQDEHDILSELIRNLIIVRWTGDDIINGYVILPGNRKITIKEALSHKTMVKIDMWGSVNDRYIEITNFFILIKLNQPKNGKIDPFAKDFNGQMINLPDDYYLTLEDSLKKEIEKLYYSNIFYKPFKMSKRMWSLARIRGDENMLDILTPLIRSSASLLSQINSEIEVLIDLIKHVAYPPLIAIGKQIDGFKSRIVNILDIDFQENEVNRIIDKLLDDKNTKTKLIELLKELKSIFLTGINEYTIAYLDDNNLLPPPRNYLPDIMRYEYI